MLIHPFLVYFTVISLFITVTLTISVKSCIKRCFTINNLSKNRLFVSILTDLSTQKTTQYFIMG